jgi:hypothetical protein
MGLDFDFQRTDDDRVAGEGAMNTQYQSSLLTKKSRFSYNQQVYFIGGIGIVKDYYFDAGKWIYTVEMPLGPEPEMGRIGPEAQIILEETEIQAE